MSITKFLTKILAALLVLSLIHCDKPTEPKPTIGQVAGLVTSRLSTDVKIHPAYIFMADSLVATTDANGEFTLADLDAGRYDFKCSALNYRDSSAMVIVTGGKTSQLLFALPPDSSVGRVYVEFQDNTLFQQALQDNPDMAGWNAEELFDGVTGATLQSKTLRRELVRMEMEEREKATVQ